MSMVTNSRARVTLLTGALAAGALAIGALATAPPAGGSALPSSTIAPSVADTQSNTVSPAAQTGPPLSVKAPLPKSAYRGLACNPFTKRLRKTALPNGVGPEARVAAACLRLEWRKRGKVSTPPITVHHSPTYPDQFIEQLEAATVAGHRLFGRFADVESYEILASLDANYSCP